ncbi:MAG: ParB/RepB/Spo0J family partition protein [Candidatus Aminicenantes bacterium]|nr:ParB/RepB/Spo0J family partition protein [Candidatus Aminicenantes bacterium]
MQKTKRSGLPEAVKMKHDGHFVDLISARSLGPRLRMIPIEKIDPNPHQARCELGNIGELQDSIKSKGILEPILVRAKGNRFEIIAGERRFMASKNIGIKEMPCIDMDVEDNEAMEIALIENLQRKDLDIFEEADGLQALADIHQYHHQDISDKIGKARSTITEILSIAKIPRDVRDLIRQTGVFSRTTIIEIAKQKSDEDMLKLAREIVDRRLTREDTRDLAKFLKGKTKKLKYYVYNFVPDDNDKFRLRLEFKKQTVSKQEIIAVLQEIIDQIRNKDEAPALKG